MPLSARENFLRNVTMTGPEWMPVHFAIGPASWAQYGDEIDDVLERHPTLFPNFQRGRYQKQQTNLYGVQEIDEVRTDNWGCKWAHNMADIMGLVVEEPLDDWDKFDAFTPPDPLKVDDFWNTVDWEKIAADIAAAKTRGDLTAGDLAHGFLFMRLYYLRGFENLMVDYASEEPKLQTLIDMVTDFNLVRVQQFLRMGVDLIDAGDDLGTQEASMVSPATFRRWITPAYKKLFLPARAAGCQVSLHTDGHMIELIDELIDAGVTICNPQDLCNGIDNIKAAVDGRICIRLDIDRQAVVPFGTRREIHDLVEEGVRKLGSPRGGLELIVGIYPPTPPDNIDAVCCAFEEFRTYWFDGRGKA